MSTTALVLAAGRGERFGAGIPKAFVPLAGESLLARSIRALAASNEISWILPVLPAADFDRLDSIKAELAGIEGLCDPVAGGAERQDSMRAGLAALPEGTELVAVHDAARPFVAPADVSRVIAKAREEGAALLAVPVKDTVKRVRAGRVVETPERSALYAAQTPQVFRVELLTEAVERAVEEGVNVTDDAQLVERLGHPVWIVEGSPGNIKITTPSDLIFGEAWLRRSQGDEEEA